MRLSAPSLGVEIELEECTINTLIIENEMLFSFAVRNLWDTSQNEFILHDADKLFNIDKELECIINPFSIDFNDRKILTKVMQQMKEESEMMFQEKSITIRGDLSCLIEGIIQNVQYELEFNYDFDIVDLFKAVGIKVCTEYDTLFEKLVEYIKLKKALLNTSVFIFVNIKQYLKKEEIEDLVKISFYEKFHMIFLESYSKYKLPSEKITIIDADMCIIKSD